MLRNLIRVSVTRARISSPRITDTFTRGILPVSSSCTCHNHIFSTLHKYRMSSWNNATDLGFISRPASSSIFSKLINNLGFKGKLKYNSYILKRSALRLYICAVEIVDQDLFFKELALEDTFYSWFKITELHIWMCMCRLASEGREGIVLRNHMMKYMWEDMEKRMRKLGGVDSHNRKEGMDLLSGHLKCATFSYDEGLLGDDKDMAGAVWRTFFDQKCDDPEKISLLVEYIRKQLNHLGSADTGVLMRTGIVTFLPLVGPEDKQRTKMILTEITRRI